MKALAYVGGVLSLFVVALFVLTGIVKATIVSGDSMYPTYNSGDVVVLIKNTDYQMGDVIVYHPESLNCDKCNVVHRIVDGNEVNGWVTQGDNNSNVDGWRPKNHEILGEVNLHLPVGAITPIILSPKFGMMIMGISGILFVVSLLQNQLRNKKPEETNQEVETTSINA